MQSIPCRVRVKDATFTPLLSLNPSQIDSLGLFDSFVWFVVSEVRVRSKVSV